MVERWISRGSAALNGVMHPPEGGPQAVFQYRQAPRYPTGDNPAPGHLKDRAACYHFATQLDGTRQNGLIRSDDSARLLALKTLTKGHRKEWGGMAKGEFQDRCLKPLGHPSIVTGLDT
jgi:hypothetical protein